MKGIFIQSYGQDSFKLVDLGFLFFTLTDLLDNNNFKLIFEFF